MHIFHSKPCIYCVKLTDGLCLSDYEYNIINYNMLYTNVIEELHLFNLLKHVYLLYSNKSFKDMSH